MPVYRDRNTGREHVRETPNAFLDASPRFEFVDDEPEHALEPETEPDQGTDQEVK